MKTKDLLISDFTDSAFQTMFKKYFAEIGVNIKDWEGLFLEMNTNNGGNMAYIRQCENEPLGFIQFTFITLEGWFFKERLGFIREFWVAEKFRKQGHGTELLSLAEKYFKDSGIHRIVLTAEENEQQFYLNRGYTICEYISAKNNMAVSVKNI
ncbi:MAG: GNAT family N-acetyltransferase [Ruminiclostridium sp.]|nr:GNAT family N-acetyltransferase [Ruminiclostridium sp.]